MLSFCTKQPKQKKKTQVFLLKALLLILLIGLFHSKSGIAQSLGINTTGALPDSSAMLDIISPNRGLLIPRVSLTSTSDTTTILNPATSLLVYNTNAAITGGSGLGYYYYNGLMWMNFLSGTGNSLTTPLIIGGSGVTSSLTYKPTTGVGTTGADHIFKVGNNGATEAMRILNNGNVGINTLSPAEKLEIVNGSILLTNGYLLSWNAAGTSTNARGIITTYSATPDRGMKYLARCGANGWNGVHDFYTQTTATYTDAFTMRITSANGGSVGIGTTTPVEKLSITETAATTTAQISASQSAGSSKSYFGNYNDGLWLSAGGTYRNAWVGDNASRTIPYMSINSGNADSYFAFATTPTNNAQATERMRIIKDGKVGIGVTAPATLLEILSGTNNSSFKTGAFEIQSYAVNNNWIADNFYYAGGEKYRTNGYALYASFYNGDFNVATAPNNVSGADAAATLTTRFTVKNTGNVGVGTTVPASKLDVEGGVSIGATYSGTTAAPTNGVIIEGETYIGTSTQSDCAWTGTNPKLQIFNTTTSPVYLKSYVASTAVAPVLTLAHSLGAAIGTETALADGGTFGSIAFEGVNSSSAKTIGAYIHSTQDGTAGATFLGGKLRFFTGTNATALAENMTILGSGNVGIGATSPTSKLHVVTNTSSFMKLDRSSNLMGYEGSTALSGGFGLYDYGAGVMQWYVKAGNMGIATTTPNSTLQVNGALSLPLVTPSTGNYSVNATDYTINVTIINSTITLPSAVGITGRIYFIKANGYTTTILTTSSQTIDGAAPPSIANGTGLMVQSDGSNWIKINQ